MRNGRAIRADPRASARCVRSDSLGKLGANVVIMREREIAREVIRYVFAGEGS
jgi:hypothetical protein